MSDDTTPADEPKRKDFIRQWIDRDNESGRFGGEVHTRFPPEPNGYLHIGHAKSICLNFALAEDYSGTCNLRFDDTNPCKEEQEYVDSIQEDLAWLGMTPTKVCYASDYFQQLYDWAIQLIEQGVAYVDESTPDAIAEMRGGGLDEGTNSPYRDRPVEESLDLFARMKAGEFSDGSMVLRAKIDMASANINLRDPIMYRVLHAHHHRQGDAWCVYPMYDWAHGLEDSIEGITHSVCTLEFENHRPLYDWFIDQLTDINHPQQIEFARLNLTYTVMSKRKLLRLVQENLVTGWDDPRMPTISGLRRRGYSPEAIRKFCKTIGVAKFNSTIDIQLLDHCLREDLNKTSPRVMAVLDPLKVTITNFSEGDVDQLEAINNPEDESAGTRMVPFTKEIYIERADFMEDAPKKFFRLSQGREVRLRYAYFVTCDEVLKDDAGEIVELKCSYDPATRGGDAPDGRKVKGTLHWVSASECLDAEVRLYDHLFTKENPDATEEGQDFIANLNPDSLKTITAKVEPYLAASTPGDRVQFERTGYFCVDTDSAADALVFNRTVTLKDKWKKIQSKQGGQQKKKKKQGGQQKKKPRLDYSQFKNKKK
ncbi:MAG: glutamine--tRNA ligase/YqeY domain fusion protein [Phycisphaerales bacterium]|jgi:glutaminyl-tRNA synthetase|nr:glutamine--tRNA ligase/YqeY domain fusion protein [Phycisphaerales bacterium]MBT7170693.1 glutamine--tRNA ligase/YqeY domain fusion protein [Phycisphaerales bacterium]